MSAAASARPHDFIRQIVADDLASGKHREVVTRFPPEPNGYLHIGHAKAICLDFGLPQEFGGRCHLRFDDTNPAKEEQEYIDAIQEDVRWLGFDWGAHLHHASDYFEQLYRWAEHLIVSGKAYVDEQTAEQIRDSRGSTFAPGAPSPWRDRPAAESLDLFRRMRAGEFPDGAMVLRARIDMASSNLNLRDPVLYRILHEEHPRTGRAWCIYPMYDYAHGQSDAIEGITHSLCTMEFENHRPLYEWLVDNLPVPHKPRQIEFSRLNLTHTVMSKRKLLRLVQEGHVRGWDDPRMPTLRGIRRRGCLPSAIRSFCAEVGITKSEGVADLALFEHHQRRELEELAQRRMAVLDPLKLVVTDWPAGKVERIELPNHGKRAELGARHVGFDGTAWIERDDWMDEPTPDFFRLGPGREVRLRQAFNVTCREVVRDASGAAVEIRCTHDPESRGGGGRKVRGFLHWVPGGSREATVRLFAPLFRSADPEAAGDYLADLEPGSWIERRARVEDDLAAAAPEDRFQFERLGFFYVDPVDSRPGAPVFHRIVALKDARPRGAR
jgi:glutaminyl-tRNA synthetase